MKRRASTQNLAVDKQARPSRDDLLRVILEQAREISALRSELGDRREQYRALIRYIPYPTWIYCFETLRFLDVNDAAVNVYGWSRDDFLVMTIADIRPPEDVPALIANVARMRGTASGASGPWRHRHKDGRLARVAISFQTLPFLGRSARLIVAKDQANAADAARLPEPRSRVPLSPREREVLGLVARGHTSEEIAEKLALSPKSVETYRARFMQKLVLRNRADIVRYALEHQLLLPNRCS